MADFADLDLNKSLGTHEPQHAGARWRVALILLALAGIVGTGAWYYASRRASTPAEVKVHTEQQVVPTPAAAASVPEPSDLPPLAETDPLVRQLVGALSSHPRVAAWLATDQLLRNFAVVTVNIADGRSPARQLSRVRPTGAFVARETGGRIVIDPRSYRRYDDYADAIAALDAAGTARLYTTLKPRIADAYRELGNPDGDVDAALERAFIQLLATPVIEGEIALAYKSVAYEFADPKLQSLTASQRQLLRMGPRNVALVQAKIREIAPLLGMDLRQ